MTREKAKFNSVEELETLVNEYFSKYPYIDDCQEQSDITKAKENLTNGILPTISGLCYYIGLKSINDWNTLKNRKKYTASCDKIILRLSRYWESASATGRGQTGVTNWLNTFANFPTTQTTENKGVCAVVVIGADGNRQALSDIINSAQAQRIQGLKTIEAKAEQVPNVSRETIRKNKPKLLKQRNK